MHLTKFITERLHESARKKKVLLAATWPTTTAEINHWTILDATEESAVNTHQIEAAFHFTLNGDYYGGYLRSTPMPHREAERLAKGTPSVTVRYNPTNPDQTAVLAEDNATLPFTILPG